MLAGGRSADGNRYTDAGDASDTGVSAEHK